MTLGIFLVIFLPKSWELVAFINVYKLLSTKPYKCIMQCWALLQILRHLLSNLSRFVSYTFRAKSDKSIVIFLYNLWTNPNMISRKVSPIYRRCFKHFQIKLFETISGRKMILWYLFLQNGFGGIVH
jgi:hypothetical protein